MNGQQIREYLTPRTQQEATVMDKQVKQKLNTMAFFALSAGAFGLIPVVGVVLGVSAGVYCTCKVLENHTLATENLNLYHAMRRENFIHSQNYKELGNISEVINNKESTIGNILNHIKKLRYIEKDQKEQFKIK